MRRTRLCFALLFVCYFLSANVLLASDAALVTEKSGDVSATLEGETWQVELADLLPDGVEIKVAADGSLVIVHLATEHEYRFSPTAEAKISLTDVTGEKFTASSVELVSANLTLSQEMTNQTGAVNPERVGVSAAVPAPPPAPARKSLAPSMRMQDDAGAIPETKDAIDSETRENFVGKSESGLSKPLKKKAADLALDREMAEVDASPASDDVALSSGLKLALPMSLFAKICSDESVFAVDSDGGISETRLDYVNEDWVEIEIAFVASAPEKLILKGDKQTIAVAVTAAGVPTVASAWRLEKAGFVYQAAAMWIALQQGGLPAQKVLPHLKRLAGGIIDQNR